MEYSGTRVQSYWRAQCLSRASKTPRMLPFFVETALREALEVGVVVLDRFVRGLEVEGGHRVPGVKDSALEGGGGGL